MCTICRCRRNKERKKQPILTADRIPAKAGIFLCLRDFYAPLRREDFFIIGGAVFSILGVVEKG